MRIALVVILVISAMPSLGRVADAQVSIRDLANSFIKEGDQFPELVLPDLQDGRPRSIAEFRGRKLLVHIFASW